MRELTVSEQRALESLGEAWNIFLSFPRPPSNVIDDELAEFRLAIHAAQNIILSRPAADNTQVPVINEHEHELKRIQSNDY